MVHMRIESISICIEIAVCGVGIGFIRVENAVCGVGIGIAVCGVGIGDATTRKSMVKLLSDPHAWCPVLSGVHIIHEHIHCVVVLSRVLL